MLSLFSGGICAVWSYQTALILKDESGHLE
jgi:hypothetical protein